MAGAKLRPGKSLREGVRRVDSGGVYIYCITAGHFMTRCFTAWRGRTRQRLPIRYGSLTAVKALRSFREYRRRASGERKSEDQRNQPRLPIRTSAGSVG